MNAKKKLNINKNKTEQKNWDSNVQTTNFRVESDISENYVIRVYKLYFVADKEPKV